MCKDFRQGVYFLATFLMATCLWAQDRRPANYAPDDNMIIVPAVEEHNFFDEIYHSKKIDLDQQKAQLQTWIRNEEEARMYGLEDTTTIFQTISDDEKRNFVQRNYLRFISRKLERDTNNSLNAAIKKWTADDEISAIKQTEKIEQKVDTFKKEQGESVNKKENKVQVGKSEFKFGLQVRPEIGMSKITMESSYFNMRAWVGVASGQELKIDRRFASTNTTAEANYIIHQGRLIAYVDQGITDRLGLRVSHQKISDTHQFFGFKSNEDNIIQMRYGFSF